jgi:hypothetical protein|tara:strand:- start:383 stop:562 length:180 start_codon:yes stop_codon:yes gene_type:complete
MDKNKKPKVKVIAVGKAKDYPGIKKIIEMNKEGKKRFSTGGMCRGGGAAVKGTKFEGIF